MTQHPGLLDIPAAPERTAPQGPGFRADDFEIIELHPPYDPRIAKFVGLPRGWQNEPTIAIRRKQA